MKQLANAHWNQIHEMLVREKIPAKLVGTIRGPLILTHRIQLLQPTKQLVQRMLALDTVLQASLMVEAVRIAQVNGLIEIQLPSPQPITPTGQDMRLASNGPIIAIGWDAYCKPVKVDFTQHGAMAWVGPSRRGKTQSMRSTLLAACSGSNVRYCIICQKSKLVDWEDFDAVKHNMGIVTDYEEIKQAVDWFAERTRIGRSEYEYLVIIDDLPSILQHVDIANSIATIASVGAGVGIHLLIGTQALGSKQGSGGELVEQNITARVIYKPASKQTGARNAGSGGLAIDQLTSNKGDALLSVDGHYIRIATAYTDALDAGRLVSGYSQKTWRPWQRTDQVQPGTYVGTAQKQVGTDQVQPGTYTGTTYVQPTVQPSLPQEKAPERVVPTVQPGTYIPAQDPASLRLPAKPDLNMQQKQQLYATFQHFERNKSKTMLSVFGSSGGKQSKILNEVIAEFESSKPGTIINMNERRKSSV